MFRSKSTTEVDIREVRSIISAFCRQRRIPEPANFSDDQLRAFHRFFIVESRTQIGRHGTRDSRVSASGASNPAPQPAPARSNSEAERAECQRRAKAILDEHESEQRAIERNRLLLSTL